MNILFFASLRERLSTDEEHWADLQGAQTTSDVLQILKQRGEPWASTLDGERILVSVNQEVASLDTPIDIDDELAFYPPVTGG